MAGGRRRHSAPRPAGRNRDSAIRPETLPPAPWGAETWKAWTGAIAAATGAKGRALYHPLRLALTGEEQGPEMAALLPLIGPDRVMARLRAFVV